MDAKPRCPNCSRIGKVYHRADSKRYPKEWRCGDCGLQWSTRTDYKQAFQKGLGFYNNKNYADAIGEFTYALSLTPDPDWPDYPRFFFLRAYSNGELGNNRQAIADYDQAIKLRPDYPDAFYNRGISKRNLGRYEDAIAD